MQALTTQGRVFYDQENHLLKTLQEKEKMLVISIFSFSHNVFWPIKPLPMTKFEM